MADPVNLNRFRKARARLAAREQADRNAAFHGLTKPEKDRAKAEAKRESQHLDGNRLDRPKDDA